MPASVRDRHLYILGKTGSGKSTFMLNAIVQDIASGNGVGVIDPHGDLVEKILGYVPKARIADTVYFNTTETEAPVGLNILNAETEEEIELLADDMVVMFRRLSGESWGPRMESILRYTGHALLRARGVGFLDMSDFLQDEKFRARVLSQVDFPPVVKFWERDFPEMPKGSVHPLLVRMGKFELSASLYRILGAREGGFNFYDAIRKKQIVLVNLSRGQIGQDNASLIGSMVVSQIQLAAMRQARLPEEERIPFYLYADEFQNYTTSSFETILSEARKYQLCLILAHQFISQLEDGIRKAILGNVGTMCVFPIGIEDARFLRGALGIFEPDDLVNLDAQKYEAVCRPATKADESFIFQTLPPPPAPEQSYKEAIIAHTRKRHGIRKKPVAVAQATEPELPELPVGVACSVAVPAPAEEPAGETNKERILRYVSVAGWLNTPQIMTLCYSHVAKSGRAAVASRDLKALVSEKALKVRPFGRGNVYYRGRSCNPTSHNLGVRDVYMKVVRSGYHIDVVEFEAKKFRGITPDLYVGFLASDGGVIKALFEYDTGTEGVSEITSKAARYGELVSEYRILFVVPSEARWRQLSSAIPSAGFLVGVMSEFETLSAPVFRRAQSGTPEPFFPAS